MKLLIKTYELAQILFIVCLFGYLLVKCGHRLEVNGYL